MGKERKTYRVDFPAGAGDASLVVVGCLSGGPVWWIRCLIRLWEGGTDRGRMHRFSSATGLARTEAKMVASAKSLAAIVSMSGYSE